MLFSVYVSSCLTMHSLQVKIYLQDYLLVEVLYSIFKYELGYEELLINNLFIYRDVNFCWLIHGLSLLSEIMDKVYS